MRSSVPEGNKEFQHQRERLVRKLQGNGYIRSPKVEKAMLTVPRELFVPDLVRGDSYADRPLPIRGGQTISAPHMVAEMCEVGAFFNWEGMQCFFW